MQKQKPSRQEATPSTSTSQGTDSSAGQAEQAGIGQESLCVICSGVQIANLGAPQMGGMMNPAGV
jgi:hypothetical protein